MQQRGILFVCSDNATRSPIAEALARELAPPGTEIFSAGSFATAVHPCTVRVLREIGIDVSRLRAKDLAAIPLDRIGACVILDSRTARPSLAPGTLHFYAPFDDPAASGLWNEDTLARFRALRDQLQSMLAAYFHRGTSFAESARFLRHVQIRAARADEVDPVRALLQACRLPVDGVPADLSALLIAVDADGIVGAVGLERHGRDVLLRSLAVTPEARLQHVASRLCQEVETRAQVAGASRIFLLTETAERFFRRRGYTPLDRAQAPPGIAACREFSSVCPASAVLMVRDPAAHGV